MKLRIITKQLAFNLAEMFATKSILSPMVAKKRFEIFRISTSLKLFDHKKLFQDAGKNSGQSKLFKHGRANIIFTPITNKVKIILFMFFIKNLFFIPTKINI